MHFQFFIIFCFAETSCVLNLFKLLLLIVAIVHVRKTKAERTRDTLVMEVRNETPLLLLLPLLPHQKRNACSITAIFSITANLWSYCFLNYLITNNPSPNNAARIDPCTCHYSFPSVRRLSASSLPLTVIPPSIWLTKLNNDYLNALSELLDRYRIEFIAIVCSLSFLNYHTDYCFLFVDLKLTSHLTKWKNPDR